MACAWWRGIARWLVLALLPSPWLGGLPSVASETPPADWIPVAEKFVDQLAEAQFERATRTFDLTMTRAMPPGKLREVWESLTQNAGAFENRLQSRAVRDQGYDIVVVTCQFAQAVVDVRVVFDTEGRITGLWFAPAGSSAPYRPPPYVWSEAFTNREALFGQGEYKLPGTLSVPTGKGPFPALVLVHGSGPQDRDETLGPNKPFRDLAEGLASRGVLVLRYDKRTKVHQAKMVSLRDGLTVKEETIDDAVAAARWLRAQPDADPKRLFVLGHSLGGMLMPRIAVQLPDAAGFIILAGSTRPLEDVLLGQIRYIADLQGTNNPAGAERLAALETQIARVKDPALSPSVPPADLPLGVPARYWLDLRGYAPAERAKQIRQPLLILQGGRDYQVTREDYDLWQQALAGKSNVTFKWYPDLNHFFAPGQGTAVPLEYLEPSHVAENVIVDLVDWIRDQL